MNKYDGLIPQKIKFIINTLSGEGKEAYAVGGCVRDILLGKRPHDWDIATSALPGEIQKIFGGYRQLNVGSKHGTVIVIIGGEPVEITTFRIDGTYSDGRRPDNVIFTSSITDDLARRDYTINACALGSDKIIDPFGGAEDIKNRIIKCVGDPVKRFQEDSLRILRGIRFASVLNFKVDENTETAMFRCVNLLSRISQERITNEFRKTLLGENVSETLIKFREIMFYILPELKASDGFTEDNDDNCGLYAHLLRAVQTADRDIILRAAMLFHDIAKPYCRSVSNKGGRFCGHAEQSALIAERILKRMRFPSKETDDITELIKYHSAKIEPSAKCVKMYVKNMGEQQFARLLKVKKYDCMSCKSPDGESELERLSEAGRILADIVIGKECTSLRGLAVNGDDLLKIGIPQGKIIGLILDRLLNMVLNGEIENKREVLIQAAKTYF